MPADTKTWTEFKVPDEAIGCGFHEAVRGVLSHHVVIRKGKIANYHPYPPTPWNANPRDIYGTPGPYEDAVQNTPIFEENRAGQIQRHRHHAGRPQLRSLPAVRRPHVPGRRQGARDPARADVRHATEQAHRCSPTHGPGVSQADGQIETLIHEVERLPDPAGAGADPGNRPRSDGFARRAALERDAGRSASANQRHRIDRFARQRRSRRQPAACSTGFIRSIWKPACSRRSKGAAAYRVRTEAMSSCWAWSTALSACDEGSCHGCPRRP